MDTHGGTLEEFIERSAWLKRLARRLVADAGDADELVQQGWVAALERRPGGDVARWIATVMRNFARERWRTERRREARERAVARPEAHDDDRAAIRRLDAHELVVGAVRELDEPYRTTILMRYFDELPPREIARRQHVPVRTVHTRLARALDQLRAKLDRKGGERRAWLACLGALVRAPGAPLAGTLIVNAKTLVAAVALAVIGATAWYSMKSDAVEPGSASPRVVAAPPTEVADAGADPREPVERASIAVAAQQPPGVVAQPDAHEPDVEQPARGVVVDVVGAPVGGVEVALADAEGRPSDEGRAITGPDGRFEFARTGQSRSIAIVDPAFVAVLASQVIHADAENVIVIAPTVELAGVVVDPSGRGLVGASVTLDLPDDLRASVRRVVDYCVEPTWSAVAGADGAFAITRAPRVAKARALARLAGHEDGVAELDSAKPDELRIELAPLASAIRGHVVDARGDGVEGALVAWGATTVRTDASGAFVFDQRDLAQFGEHSERSIRAIKAGALPAEVACVGESPTSQESWPRPLVLTLGGTPLSITGRVLDGDGKPIPRARIAHVDRAEFGMIEQTFGGTKFWTGVAAETLIAGESWDVDATSDADGRFAIHHLLPRAYRFRISDPRTLAMTVTAPIEAGSSDVDVRVPSEPMRSRVAGVVLSLGGEPLEGVTVTLVRRLQGENVPSPDLNGPSVETDRDGRFEFTAVSRGATAVRAGDFGVSSTTEVELDDRDTIEDLELRVPAQCHFQLDLSASEVRATRFVVLDEAREPMTLIVVEGNVSFGTTEHPLEGRVTPAIRIGQDARELVLYDDAEETLRIPLRLTSKELNVVRP